MNASTPIAATLLLAGLVLTGACTSQLGSVSTLPPPAFPVKSPPGKIIGISTPPASAAFSFDESSGQIGSAGEGAVRGLKAMAQAGAGAEEAAIVAVALLPVAAVVGAMLEVGRVLPAEALRKSEIELTAGLLAAAQQGEFSEQFSRVARERCGLEFAPVDAALAAADERDHHSFATRNLDWVLELRVVHLRLRRTSRINDSFALFIDARVRLIRAADGSAAYDAPIQFQSDASGFQSWTPNRGAPLRRVAEFGYRSMAEKIIAQLFAAPFR